MIVIDNRQFRLEAVTLFGQSFRTWFLDRKERDREGRVCLVNVCNGSEAYCRRVLAAMQQNGSTDL